MGMMIVRHKVKDYGQWRPMFDTHVEAQRAAGLINPRVYHSADSNKSEIVVVFDTEDTKKAKEFAASVDLNEAMTKAGVWTPRLSISLNRSIDPLTMRSSGKDLPTGGIPVLMFALGSLADIASLPRHVRFTPNSGHSSARVARPLCANSGHLHAC
jgi:hypothetical protein